MKGSVPANWIHTVYCVLIRMAALIDCDGIHVTPPFLPRPRGIVVVDSLFGHLHTWLS